jgi:NAD(P)-dependent dehydrogenase (short-subunit alcohol dehydrogenase family)
MNMRPSGSILVTGASTGIGRASAQALDSAGFTVFAGVRTEAAAADLLKTSPSLVPIQLDIVDAEAVRLAREWIEGHPSGQPFVGLVNNAGITVNGPLEFLPLHDLRRQLEVNLVAQLAVTQAFLSLLRASRGRIINMGSVSGILAAPALGPYCMSKFAFEAMSDTLRLELRPWGIKVIHFQPGQIASEIWDKGIRESRAVIEASPDQMIDLYQPLLNAMTRVGEIAGRDAKPAEVVARDVVKAFTARRPRARYCMGHQAWAQKIISRLPSSWRDALLTKSLRLP